MANGGLKPTTGKIIGTAMGLLIVLVAIFQDRSFDLAKSVIFIASGLVILGEYGISNLMNKDNRAVDIITAAFVITLIGVGLLSLTRLVIPTFSSSASTYILVLAGLWVGAETWLN